MSFEPRDYLQHILVEADYLIGRSADLTFDVFISDETLRRAFVRRDRLIHDYFGVDFELVSDVVRNRMPDVRRQVASILEA